MTALCQTCKYMNIRVETFIDTGRRYPTSLRYENVQDIISSGPSSTDRHYGPNERIDPATGCSNEWLDIALPNPPFVNEFDEQGQLLSSKPAKRQVLGTVESIRGRSSFCALCRLLCHAIDNNIYNVTDPSDTSTHLRPSNQDLCEVSFNYDGQGSGYRALDLSELDRDLRFGRYECEVRIARIFNFHIYPIIDTPGLSWLGGRLYSEVFDLSLAREWLRSCENLHPRCGVQSWHTHLEETSLLRFIDVQNECLVDSHGNERFVALSYVWGARPIFKATLSRKEALYRKGGLRSVWDELSITVRDAMEMTKSLGERYLWMDAICILQDDPVEKRKLISNMDAVYARAILTLVAAEGEDAAAGLPGMRPKSRHAPKVFECGRDLRLFASASTPHELILNCCWSARGWTYQEALLSARLLIFTKSVVHFSCRSTTWSENVKSVSESCAPPWFFTTAPLYEFGSVLSDTSLLPENVPPGDEDTISELRALWNGIGSDMSERRLTYLEDILDAAGGLTGLLEKRFDLTSLYGLLETNIEQSLFWSPIESGRLQRRKDQTGAPFGPTWSWCGWVGNVLWMSEVVEKAGRTEGPIDWFKHKGPGSAPFAVGNRSTRGSVQNFGYLSCITQLCTFRIAGQPHPPDWVKELQVFAWAVAIPVGSQRSGVYCINHVFGSHSEPVGSVILDDDSYIAGTSEMETDFILIDSMSYRQEYGDYAEQTFYHVLAIKWTNHVAYRVGHGRILARLWDQSPWVRRKVILG